MPDWKEGLDFHVNPSRAFEIKYEFEKVIREQGLPHHVYQNRCSSRCSGDGTCAPDSAPESWEEVLELVGERIDHDLGVEDLKRMTVGLRKVNVQKLPA